ncbi:MAG: gamma-glutamylcyclotransferase family protein [Candidatus Hodarchaeota archaeon]
MNQKNNTCYKCDKLFVYGTLQHGQSRNYILGGLKFKKAILLNYRKVEPPSLGFPFIVNEVNSNVEGEVYYGVGQSLINQIDMIEGEGKLYHRILVKVQLQDGSETDAYTYYPSEILIKNYT